MSFSRRSSRRVPPKARGPRRGAQPPPEGTAPGDGFGAAGAAGSPGMSGSKPGLTPDSTPGSPAGPLGATTGPGPIRPGSRAANRAAKRASSGVRPRQVVRGRVAGRSSRGYNPAVLGLAIGAVVIGAAVLVLGNPFGGAGPSPSPSSGALGSPTVYGDGTCPTSQPPALPAGESRLVTIETELGDIVIRVEGVFSPIAAGNFVALAECEYYDGVVFHRTPTLEDGTPFVIQGGDPNGDGSGGPGYTIADEPVAKAYRRGTVAMARTQQPNSQGSQFFIVLDDKSAPPLQGVNTYAIFGEVVSGMDVADAIYEASNGQALPTDPISMISVTVSDVPAATASPAPAATAPSAAASPTVSAGPTTAP